jgi:NADH-quinone oxidoreductase subunit N
LNLVLLSPEISLLASAVVVILLDLFIRRKGLLAIVSLAGLGVAFGFTVALWGGNSQSVFNNMLVIDKFALFFKLLFLVISALVILASTDYVSKFEHFQGEYHAIVLLSTLGMLQQS